MRATVTGGAGFIGSHLVDALDGWDVTVVDDFRSGDYTPRVASLIRSPIAAVDDALMAGDVIFHLASPVGPVGVLRQAGRIAAEVVADAAKLARVAVACRSPLVYVSTSELYGPQAGACHEGMSRVFPSGFSARMEYAIAKLAAETMLLNTPELDVRIVRPFNVAGPRQKSAGGFVIPRFIEQARAGEPLTVYQPGTQLRSFTHVADIVEGLLAVAELDASRVVFNLGNPANLTTIEALAGVVLDVVDPEGSYRIVDPRDLWGPEFREAPDKYADADLARIHLGWKPTRDLRTIVEDAAGVLVAA